MGCIRIKYSNPHIMVSIQCLAAIVHTITMIVLLIVNPFTVRKSLSQSMELHQSKRIPT